jgi:hypothetical protein
MEAAMQEQRLEYQHLLAKEKVRYYPLHLPSPTPPNMCKGELERALQQAGRNCDERVSKERVRGIVRG